MPEPGYHPVGFGSFFLEEERIGAPIRAPLLPAGIDGESARDRGWTRLFLVIRIRKDAFFL